MKHAMLAGLLLIIASGLAFTAGSQEETVQGATLTDPKVLDSLGYKSSGFPIVTKPFSISVFMGTHSLLGSKEELETKSVWIKDYQAMTGVELKLDWVLNLAGNPSPWTQQMNLAMASGELPEMFWKANFQPLQLMQFGRQGVLMDLAPLIDAGHMPNLSALMKKYPEIRKTISTPDGKIYGLAGMNFNEVNRVQTNTIINTAWLQKLGLSQPKTLDEFYKVLVAFKTQDPNGNGIQDEWPAIFTGVGDVMSWMRHFGFLMNNHSMYLEQESKEIIHVPSHPDYKQFLVWMKKLYDEGLMHPDSFTLNIDQRRAIASGPVPLVGTGNTNSPGLIASGLSQNAKSDDLGITENRRGEMDYAFMEPVAGPNNGRRLINASSPISINGHFALTTKCKYPEIAVRWVDYFFTDEGGAFLWAGKANQAYRLPSGQVGYAGGKLEWLKPDGTVAGGNEENDVRKFNTMQPGGRIPGLTPMLIENLDYNLYPIKKAVAEWASDAVPPFFFEDETIKSLASISADVDPYIQQFTANAIVGSVDIEKEWPVYLETLNKMKLATMVDIYQSAYDKAYK